jgi:hypothetical protein
MKYPKYEYVAQEELHLFQFTSIGPQGDVKKIVQYSKTNHENVYNLGFGDYNHEKGGIDDLAVTNNGDSQRVLATVASTVYAFTGKFPDAWVFATGSTKVRTRLYRMGITNNLVEIQADFHVYGMREDDTFEEFVVGEDYLGFLVKRKK